MRTEEKLIHFAQRVETEQAERYRREFPEYEEDADPFAKVSIIRGKKYVKVDVGSSGKFMITEAGEIFGIKGYGVIHRGHQYGTLDTIDEWNWGDYKPTRKPEPSEHKRLHGDICPLCKKAKATT